VSATPLVAPGVWIALLRVVVGAWFLKAAWTKLALATAAGLLPYPTVSPRFLASHPKRVAEFAAGNPFVWYREFLHDTVLPNAATFATLQAYGEVAVGLALLLGAGTVVAALVGLFLSVNYGLATQWMSPGQQGFHLVLIASMVVFAAVGGGRAWGLDALLRRAAPRSRVVRVVT
jgi:uncharacterized membrane protein YphA (DoxX/SURF4 family)